MERSFHPSFDRIADEFRRGRSRSSYPASDLVDLAGAEALMGGNPHQLLIELHCHVVRAGLGRQLPRNLVELAGRDTSSAKSPDQYAAASGSKQRERHGADSVRHGWEQRADTWHGGQLLDKPAIVVGPHLRESRYLPLHAAQELQRKPVLLAEGAAVGWRRDRAQCVTLQPVPRHVDTHGSGLNQALRQPDERCLPFRFGWYLGEARCPLRRANEYAHARNGQYLVWAQDPHVSH